MAAALTLMLIFVITFSLVRIAAVALRLTGMAEDMARFQALSALTGTGYTTAEAEMVVNYPIRRKIATWLMIVGNLGIMSVLSTIMVSFIRIDTTGGSLIVQLLWFCGGILFLSLVMLNKKVDTFLCGIISKLLQRYSDLGKNRHTCTLQISSGLSVREHRIVNPDESLLSELLSTQSSLTLLAIRNSDGSTRIAKNGDFQCVNHSTLVIYGTDEDHALFSDKTDHREK